VRDQRDHQEQRDRPGLGRIGQREAQRQEQTGTGADRGEHLRGWEAAPGA
jgi:hypothetical protein